MTQSDFLNLSSSQQDQFLQEGGIISPEPVVSESSTETSEKEKLAEAQPLAHSQVEHDSSVSHVSEEPQPALTITEVDTYKEGFDFQSPLEMLVMLDDDVRSGRVDLSKQQVEHLTDYSEGGRSDKTPFQCVVRWPNGSGKDKYIVAPEVVWTCMRHRRARGVVTSSSGFQLDMQTCTYIEQLAKEANRKWGNVWKINYRYYECLPTESPIACFATDEAGKAEGFHPLEFGRKMAMFASEDKTIPDDIYIAQNKCTGYTHRTHVSTPGQANGHFYNLCMSAVNRTQIKSVLDVRPEDYVHYHATAYDFKHISKAYIEQMKRDLPGGEFGSAFRSQVLAEFGTTDEMVVVAYTYVWRAIHTTQQWQPEPHNKAGLDLSDGGAESVLFVRNGNKALKLIPFRFDNTEDTVKFCEQQFEQNGLTHPEAYIYGDCVGMGKPILDRLKRRGWRNIRYFDSRSNAREPKVYFRRGDEVWFTFGKRMERGEIILLKDDLLCRQLSTRYYKILEGKHKLLSKLEQRTRGYPSPDRADACVYAFSDYTDTIVKESDEKEERPYEYEEPDTAPVSSFTQRSRSNGYQKIPYNQSVMNNRYNVNGGQKAFNDIQSELDDYNKNLRLTEK